MTRPGSLKGAYVLSARFLEWARDNGRAKLIGDVERARKEYRTSGAATSRYGDLSDADLKAAQKKASVRKERLDAEVGRREDRSPVAGEVPPA